MTVSEGPIRAGSLFYYQIAMFLLVFIWAFMGFEVAQFQLLLIYDDPFNWIVWAIFIQASMIPAIAPVIWRMKTRVQYVEPDWDFREREVSLNEYDTMMKQYRGEYRNVLSVVDYELILLALLIAVIAVTAPLLLMRTTFLLIAATPVIFGLLVLCLGLVFASALFKFIPNEATLHFPFVAATIMRPSIEIMQRTPGISWTGVSITLGESDGYYTVRNATPVSRIEGIESIAKLQGVCDESGRMSQVVSFINLDESSTPEILDKSSGEISTRQLASMVERVLQTYIENKGPDEFLDEVLEEVSDYLKRHIS